MKDSRIFLIIKRIALPGYIQKYKIVEEEISHSIVLLYLDKVILSVYGTFYHTYARSDLLRY